MNSNSAIDEVKGIGTKTKESFAKLGVYTVGDILLNFPKDYTQYPEIETISELENLTEGYHAFRAHIVKSPVVRAIRTMQITLLELRCPAGNLQLIWYRAPYIKSQLSPGKNVIFYGKVVFREHKYFMEQPVIYEEEKYALLEGRLQPVYSLASGITNNLIVRTLQSILAEDDLLSEHLPSYIRKEEHLCEYNYAIKQIHFPDSMSSLIEARKRLVFDEFFMFIMGMQYQKGRQQKIPNAYTFCDTEWIFKQVERLPYSLTGAQMRALSDIVNDMVGPFTMQRLVQGDVGSGKTIVAFMSMAWCGINGYQSAIMAPTEVLAMQHYESFLKLCNQYGYNLPVILLCGSLTVKQKKEAYEKIRNNPNALIIGTHALIQEKVIYDNLALVVTDEQHRFGVKQRDVFSSKGKNPHILVMSATPIPRTLAIIIYGDLDISVIDEVPAQRLPIKNCVVDTNYRPKAYDFIEKEIESGHQAYVICPLVEETENMDAEDVAGYTKRLEEYFAGRVRIGTLHGKMKPALKNSIMSDFASNKIQILVSTTVVEVGVNVPNSTVMMIENADRFGLAQLHQLRGRVGRGDAQSYCIMINSSKSKTAKQRLEILNRSNDGFFIASEDLKLRGPGDFFGIRQSGDMAFKLADIYQDAAVLQKASVTAKAILEHDPELEEEEHIGLKYAMKHFMDEQLKKMNL